MWPSFVCSPLVLPIASRCWQVLNTFLSKLWKQHIEQLAQDLMPSLDLVSVSELRSHIVRLQTHPSHFLGQAAEGRSRPEVLVTVLQSQTFLLSLEISTMSLHQWSSHKQLFSISKYTHISSLVQWVYYTGSISAYMLSLSTCWVSGPSWYFFL